MHSNIDVKFHYNNFGVYIKCIEYLLINTDNQSDNTNIKGVEIFEK